MIRPEQHPQIQPGRTRWQEPPSSAKLTRAFSLIELLVVMTLLSVIVLGLLVVFEQTQRAFKLGMAQVDVIEGGRAAMDLIARDVEDMAVLKGAGTNVVNFVAEIPKDPNNASVRIYEPLLQELPGLDRFGNQQYRTNLLQELFFVSRVNQDWLGTGYFVSDGEDGIGQLYRYTTNVPVRALDAVLNDARVRDLYELYKAAPLTNFNRVADGVVHLQVNAYATNGYPVDPFLVYPFGTNAFANRIDAWYDGVPDSVGVVFLDKTLPTAVEIELGMVEPDVVERARALPAGTIRREYIEKEAGKVHLFKRRVPIRAADPKAYNQ